MSATCHAIAVNRSMPEERVEWHLENWERWMRSDQHGERIAIASAESRYCASRDFDSMLSDADSRCAEAADAVIDALPQPQHVAVYALHGLIGAGSSYAGAMLRDYNCAKETIARGLTARGIP